MASLSSDITTTFKQQFANVFIAWVDGIDDTDHVLCAPLMATMERQTFADHETLGQLAELINNDCCVADYCVRAIV